MINNEEIELAAASEDILHVALQRKEFLILFGGESTSWQVHMHRWLVLSSH